MSQKNARPTEDAGIRVIRDAMDDTPLLILFRLKNNHVEYSFANRPEPNLSNVSDAVLLAALLGAGRSFEHKRVKSVAKSQRAIRNDGSDVGYKESVEIDWEERRIESSRGKKLTLTVLSIVVQNLATTVAQQSAELPASEPN